MGLLLELLLSRRRRDMAALDLSLGVGIDELRSFVADAHRGSSPISCYHFMRLIGPELNVNEPVNHDEVRRRREGSIFVDDITAESLIIASKSHQKDIRAESHLLIDPVMWKWWCFSLANDWQGVTQPHWLFSSHHTDPTAHPYDLWARVLRGEPSQLNAIRLSVRLGKGVGADWDEQPSIPSSK